MKAYIVFLGLLLGAFRAQASVVVALPESELVREADTIVLAKILKVQTEITAQGRVVTRAEAQVLKNVYGATPNEIITIEVPGGVLKNGLVASVAGAPRLKPDDMVFGYLETGGVVKRPLGLSYGLLRVRLVGPGDLRVFREITGLTLLSPDGSKLSPDKIALKELPLATLISRIEGHLGKLGRLPVKAGRP